MIIHKGTHLLYTDRLSLRRFTSDDAIDMYTNWASDPRVTQYLSWKPHTSPEETKTLVVGWEAAYTDPSVYNWAMEYNGEIIGNIGVVQRNDKREWAAIGYCMCQTYWNLGLMTEAVKVVTDYLFTEIGYHRLEISHAVKNPASGRVAQKCGFNYEGTKRESFKTADDEFLDVAYYGLLKRDTSVE